MPMQSQTQGQAPMQELHSPTAAGTGRRSRRGWVAGIAVLILFTGLLAYGILERIHTNASLRTETADLAVPTGSVVQAKRAAPSPATVVAGHGQAIITAPVFARPNGYPAH